MHAHTPIEGIWGIDILVRFLQEFKYFSFYCWHTNTGSSGSGRRVGGVAAGNFSERGFPARGKFEGVHVTLQEFNSIWAHNEIIFCNKMWQKRGMGTVKITERNAFHFAFHIFQPPDQWPVAQGWVFVPNMLALIFIYPSAEVAPLYYSYSVLGGGRGWRCVALQAGLV